MTPQHPAAPETETDANGLREAIAKAVGRELGCVRKGLLDGHQMCGEHHYGWLSTGECPTQERVTDAVLSAARERVRAVEGERDAAREQGTRLADGLYRWRDDAERYLARAESAEAAHEAEKAAHERRVKRAEALLDAWEHDAPGLVDPVFAGRLREVLRRDPAPVRLRGDDALGGGEAR